MSRVVVVGLSRALRVFLRFSSLRKINMHLVSYPMAAAEGAFNMPFDLTTLICVLRNSATGTASKDD